MIRYGCSDADLRRLRAAYALLIDFGRALTCENASFDKLPLARSDGDRLGAWTDPRSSRRVSVWAFVMVLAHSRHMFVRQVISMDQRAWSLAHIAAFTFFGGVPARIVPDNLATG